MIHLEPLPAIHPRKCYCGIVNHAKPHPRRCTKQRYGGVFSPIPQPINKSKSQIDWRFSLAGLKCLLLLLIKFQVNFLYITPIIINKKEHFYITSMVLKIFPTLFSLEESPFSYPKYCSWGYTVNSIAHVMTGRWGNVVTRYTAKKQCKWLYATWLIWLNSSRCSLL